MAGIVSYILKQKITYIYMLFTNTFHWSLCRYQCLFDAYIFSSHVVINICTLYGCTLRDCCEKNIVLVVAGKRRNMRFKQSCRFILQVVSPRQAFFDSGYLSNTCIFLLRSPLNQKNFKEQDGRTGSKTSNLIRNVRVSEEVSVDSPFFYMHLDISIFVPSGAKEVLVKYV